MSADDPRRFAGLLLLLVASLVATSCAGPVYKLYPGAERSSLERARLNLGSSCSAIQVDGLRVSRRDYGSVDLAPGTHEVRWRPGLGQYWWDTPEEDDEDLHQTLVADLKAGEAYSVHLALETDAVAWLRTEVVRSYLWIQNDRTGVVIAGKRKR